MKTKFRFYVPGLVLSLWMMLGVARADVQLDGSGVRLLARESGSVEILDAAGQPRFTVGDYAMVWSLPSTDGGTPSLITNADGKPAIEVRYRLKDDASGAMRVLAQFTPLLSRVHLRYEVWAPDSVNVGGAMLSLQSADNATRSVAKNALWTRDAGGGIPYETNDASGLFYRWTTGASAASASALVALQNANLGWLSSSTLHFPPQKVEDGHYVAQGDIVLSDKDFSASALASVLGERPLALDISTAKPFNIWESNAQNLVLQTQLSNVSEAARAATLSWWARDFNGRVLSSGSKSLSLAARSTQQNPISFKGPSRGIVFMEVQAKSGDFTIFRRTNLAVMPPVTFQSGRESIFGIAAFFDLPSQADAMSLLKRIGVRWLRGQAASYPVGSYGMFQNHHSNVELTGPPPTADWLKEQWQTADARGAEYWELGNEWNMAGGIGKALHAEKYVNELLIPADEMRQSIGAKAGLMSMGLAGTDEPFLDKIAAMGAWNRFDALAIHTGRGNYTPDFNGVNPDGSYQYWNYLGTIQAAKRKLAQHGQKPLYITEAYASTNPNHWWTDTHRQSAESVVLSYALAKAEGVRVMNWYQLHDTVWFDQNGVNSEDTEYHFGLLNRDLSPKPSLLGYQTIAQALDQASFTRALNFPNSQNKGLLFSKPSGPVAVLWNRSDGYVLNKNHAENAKLFAAPEAWIDHWPTKTTLSLAATGSSVTEINSIGIRRTLPVYNGKVTVKLDGAPRIYYGLSANIGQ